MSTEKKIAKLLSTPLTFSGKTKAESNKRKEFDHVCILVCSTDVYNLNL